MSLAERTPAENFEEPWELDPEDEAAIIEAEERMKRGEGVDGWLFLEQLRAKQ